jgi:hypothetical protein
LQSLQTQLAEYEVRLTSVRQRITDLRARTLALITYCVIGIALVSAWIALSQAIVLAHACSWWKKCDA